MFVDVFTDFIPISLALWHCVLKKAVLVIRVILN